jgi:iron-sulfur cluster repair protein YtfE (RIC family)
MANIIELLEKDHREVEQLFGDFESSKDAAIAERICDELTKHTYGEERSVYPLLAERITDGHKLTTEAIDEHKEARQVIGRIRNTADEAHLAELMTELKSAIEHHVQEEETQVLPRAREQLSPNELENMGHAFEETKEVAGKQTG